MLTLSARIIQPIIILRSPGGVRGIRFELKSKLVRRVPWFLTLNRRDITTMVKQQRTSLEFKVIKGGEGEVGAKARLGELEVKRVITADTADEVTEEPVGVKLLTPACFYYTQAANLIPHLTSDVAASLKNTSYQPVTDKGVESGEAKKLKLEERKLPNLHFSSLDHFVNLAGYTEGDKKFSSFSSSEENLSLLDLHDPSLLFQNRPAALLPWKSGNKFATLATTNGLHKLTPEAHHQVLTNLLPDLAVPLYDCLPNPLATAASQLNSTGTSDAQDPTQKRAQKSVERTTKWTEVVVKDNTLPNTAAIGAVVGGSFPELRVRSATAAKSLGDALSGYLITNFYGPEEEVINQLQQSVRELSKEVTSPKPLFSWDFLSPREVLLAIDSGVDVFSTVYPYLVTDYGHALTFDFSSLTENLTSFSTVTPVLLNLNRPTSDYVSEYQSDLAPISPHCSCYCCTKPFSRAYLVHLLNTHEMLAKVLLMCHNMQQYLDLFARIRTSISQDQFSTFATSFHRHYQNLDWYGFFKAELTERPRPATPL